MILYRSRNDDSYEFRTVSFMSFRAPPFRLDLGPEWEELKRALAHAEAYADFGIGCEMPEWEDRANREDCWREWWRADWIQPERGEEDDDA